MRLDKGFLLIEVLIAILILSVALTASMGGIALALRIAKEAGETTNAILAFEELLYLLETGERMDLIFYGGKGSTGEYSYEIESEGKDSMRRLKTQFLRGENHLFDFDLFIPEGKAAG